MNSMAKCISLACLTLSCAAYAQSTVTSGAPTRADSSSPTETTQDTSSTGSGMGTGSDINTGTTSGRNMDTSGVPNNSGSTTMGTAGTTGTTGRGSMNTSVSSLTRDPAMVRQIQQNLNDQGHDVGAVDGKWGSRTTEGLRNFQRAKGMEATGRIDQRTVSALGIPTTMGTMGTTTTGSGSEMPGTSGSDQMNQQGRSPTTMDDNTTPSGTTTTPQGRGTGQQ